MQLSIVVRLRNSEVLSPRKIIGKMAAPGSGVSSGLIRQNNVSNVMNAFRRSGTPVIPLKRGLTCFDLMRSATSDEVKAEEYPTAVQISSQRNGMLSNSLRRSVFSR